MKLAFLIAGNELYAWRSKHNRIVARMMQGYTEARIIKLLEQNAEGEYKKVMLTPKLIQLIKGEENG